MPRVLITGAAGFIGMHTSIRFLKEGWDVVGLDNMNDYYSVSLKRDRVLEIQKYNAKVNFIFYEEDLNSSVWQKLGDYNFDAVVHLAAQAGVRYSINHPRKYIESNILGFQSVLEFIEKYKIPRFLYASSSSVYGENSQEPFSESETCDSPESYYAATKRANELMAYSYFKTKGISSIGLRFFTVYGPWGRPDMAPMLFANAASNHDTIKVFNWGRQKRDFTFIDDVVEGIFLLIIADSNQGAKILNLGNGSPTALTDFIFEIEKSFSISLEKEFVEPQNGDVTSTYADLSAVNKIIGWKPKTDLSEGIKEFAVWYNSYFNT